jgi:CheY-like chemotaxis protein
MDGLQASRIIKRDNRLQYIPKIIMVTAFGRENIGTQAEESGIDAYLLKPVNVSVLYDTLMDLFGVARTSDHLPRTKEHETRVYDLTDIRVLLVEDNEINQQIATELLKSAGARVTIADHGGEAVRLLTAGPQAPSFDIVLMDVQMPEMDGFTATRLLRNDSRFKTLPIIAMTAHALVEERQRCFDAGMNDHIAKPIDPNALFSTVLRWAKPKSNAASESEQSTPEDLADVFLPQVSGINSADGLKRVAGNRQLYRELLLQFTAKQADAAAQISAALDGGDPKRAEAIAHTVKGVAGNLGITHLHIAAETLERAIRETQSGVPALLDQFAVALRMQITAIEQSLGDSAPVEPPDIPVASLNGESAAIAIGRLKALLEASDGEAQEAFRSLHRTVAGVVDKPYLDALSAYINDFDYEMALIKLNEIARFCEQDRQRPK